MASSKKANKKPSQVIPETAKVENLEQHSNTKGDELKLSPAQKQMDTDLKPIWESLTPAKARVVFKRLGRDLGKSKHFTELCASYLRFLKAREEG